ncbi:hypothetical protein [Candidatus Hepatobacter penaei]|nr:hypothetical protein [Candidatus Hepatobacter penaei]
MMTLFTNWERDIHLLGLANAHLEEVRKMPIEEKSMTKSAMKKTAHNSSS